MVTTKRMVLMVKTLLRVVHALVCHLASSLFSSLLMPLAIFLGYAAAP